jgi:membrane protease YdiL (CAAX protease family)
LLALIFGAFALIGGPIQVMNLAFGVWFTELVVFFGLAYAALSMLGVDPVRETALDSTTPKALALGFLVGLVNYLAWAIPLMGAVQRMMPKWVLELFDGSQIFHNLGGLELVVVVLGLGFAAPFGEEFFFRGVIQHALGLRLAPPSAIVITALIFSAFHLDPVGFLARFELGVVFGLLAWRSGSIWPGLAAHAANNLVASALFFVSGGDEPEGEVPLLALAGCLVVGNVLLALIVRFTAGAYASPRPAAVTNQPRRAVIPALLPWALAGAVGVAAVLLFDLNGVKLRFYETAHPLPHGLKTEALSDLRQKARKGLISLDDYEQAYEALRPDAKP